MTLPRFCLNTDKPDSCSPTDVFHSFACTSCSVHSANGWWLSQTGLYIFSDPKRQGWPWLPQTPCKVSSSRLTLGPWAASPRSPPPNPQEKAPFLLLLPISGCSSPKPDLESDPGDWGLGAALHLGSNVPRRKRKVPIPPPPPPGIFPWAVWSKASPPAAFTWEGMRHNLWKPASWAGAASVRMYRKQLHCRGASQKKLLCWFLLPWLPAPWTIRVLLLLLLLLLFRLRGVWVQAGEKGCFKWLFSNRQIYGTFIVTLQMKSHEGTGFSLFFFFRISEFVTN